MRIIKLVLPLVSWAVGITLFVLVTFSRVSRHDPEWYAVVASLMSLPVVSLFGQHQRKKDDEA